MSTTVLIVLVIVVLAVIAVAAWAYSQKRRSEQLRAHFGSEYDRTVEQSATRGTAEKELEDREKRVDALAIQPLSDADRTRYSEEWQAIQALFVDDPAAAVKEADRIIGDVMRRRGYPVGDFEQRAADISVEHPSVVTDYRAARSIAVRAADGGTSTDDLRTALVHYRSLFQELLATGQPQQTTEVRR
jgi:FtsZ-interacting cell division protein ZipA